MTDCNSIRVLGNKVLVTDIERGPQMVNGIWLLSTDGKSTDKHPHWAKVHTVGPDVNTVLPGQWVLVQHLRWDRATTLTIDGTETHLWQIDWPSAALAVSDEKPENVYSFSQYS